LKISPSPSPGRPFAELDALYEFILNPPDIDILLMKRLLHVIIEITRLSFPLSARQLEKFLSLDEGTIEMTFCDLHSTLSVGEGPWIRFHHKSLDDYLCSPERSGSLYQSQADTQSDILTVCTHNLEHWNRKLVNPNAECQLPRCRSYSLLFV
jgi:hypothetical protein